jgi:hypothetical protein
MGTPAYDAQIDRVATVLAALEATPVKAHAHPLCVISRDAAPRTVVAVYAADRRFVLGAEDVELTARILTDAKPFTGAGLLAGGLLANLAVAELLALRANVVRMCSPMGRG